MDNSVTKPLRNPNAADPSPSIGELTRIHNMARRLAYKLAIHECPDEVAKDLEQAGRLAWLVCKKRQHIWKDLEYAMLEEVSRWLYGCKRGRGKDRVMRCKISLEDNVMYMGKPYPLSRILV